jgi:hypothetical protein
MTEARIGRLLAACLHEAIGDLLPQRLDFYEEWLRSEGLRDGSIGLAPMTAVLGFLRTEQVYQGIVGTAGRLAADWTVASMSPLQRRAIGLLPRGLRVRASLRVAAGIVRHVSSTSRASTRLGRNEARIDVTASLFCTVREVQKLPLCGFYAAATTQTFRLFGLPVRARVERCLAVDGGMCVIALDLPNADTVSDAAMAA